jgi:hypothetical protein
MMDEDLKKEILELIKETQRLDSIDIGNSKTGIVKVYVDFDKKEEAEKKLKIAIELLKANRNEVLNMEK